jgi:hypothetical protein
MAKTQIKNYVFKPGLGVNGNLHPNAYTLLSENKAFIQAEATEFINQEIIDAVKCKRDIGYMIDGVAWDVVLGTNYNAIFLGLTEVNSLDLSETVYRTIDRAKNATGDLAAIEADATALARLNAAWDEIVDIAKNGRDSADTLSFTNPTNATASRIAAKDKLIANIAFLQAEVNSFVNVNYPDHNHDVDKCSRDVKYAIWAAAYDILYGGNSASYDSAKFFNNYAASGSNGITAEHQAQTVAAYRHLQDIIDNVVQGAAIVPSVGNTETQVIAGTNASASDATAVAALIDIVADVVENGTGALPVTRTIPSIGWATSTLQTAKNSIVNAKDSIIADITWDENYTYNQTKCERDVGYVIDAYLEGLQYGGNEKLRNTIKYYWDQDVAQVDGNRIPEIDTHNFIGDLINDYILKNVAFNAQGTVSQYIDTATVSETTYFTPTNATYTPASGRMTLVIGEHNLTAGEYVVIQPRSLIFTCNYDGHATEHPYPRSSGVPNSANTDPYYQKQIKIIDVTDNAIILDVGISSNTTAHTFIRAEANAVVYGPEATITTFVQNTVEVITNGLSSMPAGHSVGVGYVRIQGRFSTDELLLITNTTHNEIIYNFSDPEAGGEVIIKDHGEDDDFVKYLQTTDAVTTVRLKYDTRAHSDTDDLQIFVEKTENGKSQVITRPYDFGTDAIERQRIAPPMSMLDADFEYGLQPTKWSAIAMMRGYPSVYEVPGTDTEVSSVITDASSGTNGVGASLITVTTNGAHGFTAGTPITIKALETSVQGAARAEGSFVIVEVPTNNTFTYYAKSKVGTAAGQQLSAGYTQLRKGGFYTGAGIDGAEVDVLTNGSAGTMTTELQVAAGSNTVPFDGNAPEIGSPLTSNFIPEGAQVTSVVTTSAGGGEYLTLNIGQNAVAGDTSIGLFDATGVVQNLALDRGDGQAVFINSVVGSTINLSGQLTENVTSNTRTYPAITAQTLQPQGTGLLINITRSGGTYSLDSIFSPGINYEIGDSFKIFGEFVGGSTGANDVTGEVTGVNANGGVTTMTLSGTAVSGTASYSAVEAANTGGNGTGSLFDVTLQNGSYIVSLPGLNVSENYVVGDRLIILGSTLGGIDGTNDLEIKVTSIQTGAGGEVGNIATVSSSGTAADVDTPFTSPAYTTGSAGTGADFDIRMTGTTYSVIVTVAGNGYSIGDTFTVLGTALSGASPTNDAVITVDNVGAGGDITAASISGTASNTFVYSNIPGTNIVGSGALVNVDLAGGAYTVTLDAGGINYGVDQQLIVTGDELQGSTPANDLTITITAVDVNGTITGFTSSGTGSNGTESYTEVQPVNVAVAGNGAQFSVTRANGSYSDINDIEGGVDYQPGDRLILSGSDLDGQSPANDISIIVTTVDALNNNAITGFTTSFDSAELGTQIPLYATFTMTENTNGIMPAQETITFSAIATLEISFPNAHGLVPGDTFIVSTSTDDGANNHALADGAFLVTNIPSIDRLRYTARAAGTISTSAADPINGTVYARPDSFFVHRPFDGGVQLGTGGPQHGAQAIRQSKKYIRYQSGKGIMYTTGALFAPSYDLRSVSATGTEVGSLITVTTDDNDHGVQPGGIIRLIGIETPGYNSGVNPAVPPGFDYTVEQVIDERSFTVRAQRRLGDTAEIILTPTVNNCPLVTAFVDAANGTNDNDVHDFFINELAPDGYPWGDLNQSGSFTIDDTNDLINYLNGVTLNDALTARIELMLNELRLRRNTGVVEDVIGIFDQQADIGFGAQMSVVSWHGATVRSGIFDDQNGIFWEYDGTNISVNQRTGTQQVAGTVAIDRDSNIVTGTSTRFRDQITAGDRVIIRGMTHVVTHVNNQTQLTVTPDFRGIESITGAKINLVVDKKVKQENFNLDTLDGNGPSGYDIDIAKMQMIGIQYSWYGAGFIDFMLRGQDGNFIFCHRMRNSNINTEAFMRSGNLPVRYEVTNEGPPGKLAAALDDSATTLELEDGSFFPQTGTVYIDNEIINFSGRSANHLTGLQRGGTLTNFQAGAERTYSAGAAAPHLKGTGVILISNTITPLISHWGSAFLTDGGFDEDRGYIFSYAEPAVAVTTTKQTAFMIRLAPSVSNAIPGDLGQRELLNRAQLLLQGLEVTSDIEDGSGSVNLGGIVIEGVLNPQNYPTNPNDVGWTGLSGVAQGGQPSFAQVASGGSVVWSTGDAATTATATAQGNSSFTANTYFNTWRRGNYLYIDAAQYEANGPAVVGATVTGPNIRSGTTITSISDNGQYYFMRLSRDVSNTIGSGTTITFTFSETLTGRNFAYLTKTSFEATGAKVGTNVTSGGSVTFPANTLINRITAEQHGSAEFYKVEFNNSFSGTLTPGSGTIEFTFVQPPYAQPGETVFSFIANPGERATVDFSELKELTNTTLGGRGTFPNGPDVLAINVYKVAGGEVSANLILRWGEAQA